MIKKMYSIKDSKVGYGDPFVAVDDSIAIRSVATALAGMANCPSELYTFPEDFELWCLGSINLDTGITDSCISCVMQVRDIKAML